MEKTNNFNNIIYSNFPDLNQQISFDIIGKAGDPLLRLAFDEFFDFLVCLF